MNNHESSKLLPLTKLNRLVETIPYPLSMMDNIKHTNTGLYIVHYTGKQFFVETFNETSHLDEHPVDHQPGL